MAKQYQIRDGIHQGRIGTLVGEVNYEGCKNGWYTLLMDDGSELMFAGEELSIAVPIKKRTPLEVVGYFTKKYADMEKENALLKKRCSLYQKDKTDRMFKSVGGRTRKEMIRDFPEVYYG